MDEIVHISGNLVHYQGMELQRVEGRFRYGGMNARNLEHCLLYTIGQFTGLLDKHDKEIFEGDIIVTAYAPRDPLIVRWDKCAFWVGKELLGQYHPTLLEIVGNIHDNPEILLGKAPRDVPS